MARGTLHQPKEVGRRRTNAPVHGDMPLVRDDIIRGPELEEITGRVHWTDFTRRWWQTWRESAQAAVFEPTDWMRLAMLAPMVDSCSIKPSAAAMGEIRMNEERLGATVVDRMRARMKFDDKPAEAPAAPAAGPGSVTSITDRLKR